MKLTVNNKTYHTDSPPEETLINVLREGLRLTGTKRGCDIGVCGTCTVLINGDAKRSCIVRLSNLSESDRIVTIEGLRPEPACPERSRRVEGLEEDGALSLPALSGVEGSKGGRLHPIQEAFIEAGAIQCGFCTPGMVLAAKALLDKNPNPSREEIKKALSANLCRCTGYKQIFEAIERAAKKMTDANKQ